MPQGLVQRIKKYLVDQGPESPLARLAVTLHARTLGFQVTFRNGRIQLIRGGRELVLRKDQLTQVPWMLQIFDLYFRTVEPVTKGTRKVLDFSSSGVHRYLASGVSFEFPSIPEDDVMEAYTRHYMPRPGDIVWDAGAHAGATSYFLAKMVGPAGKVYAFEPDTGNYEFLQRNLERHGLTNVIPVKKALSSNTGQAMFNMDNTMAAGIHDFLTYSGSALTPVETITLADACEEFGSVPAYIKMDIEGAEVATVEGSADFLKTHPIHFSIESDHKIGGEYTHTMLDSLFPRIGYTVQSVPEYGTVFTWASSSQLAS